MPAPAPSRCRPGAGAACSSRNDAISPRPSRAVGRRNRRPCRRLRRRMTHGSGRVTWAKPSMAQAASPCTEILQRRVAGRLRPLDEVTSSNGGRASLAASVRGQSHRADGSSAALELQHRAGQTVGPYWCCRLRPAAAVTGTGRSTSGSPGRARAGPAPGIEHPARRRSATATTTAVGSPPRSSARSSSARDRSSPARCTGW